MHHISLLGPGSDAAYFFWFWFLVFGFFFFNINNLVLVFGILVFVVFCYIFIFIKFIVTNFAWTLSLTRIQKNAILMGCYIQGVGDRIETGKVIEISVQ